LSGVTVKQARHRQAGRGDLRGSGANIGELPFEVCFVALACIGRPFLEVIRMCTFLQLLQAFESDFELIRRAEVGRIVEHFDPK